MKTMFKDVSVKSAWASSWHDSPLVYSSRDCFVPRLLRVSSKWLLVRGKYWWYSFWNVGAPTWKKYHQYLPRTTSRLFEACWELETRQPREDYHTKSHANRKPSPNLTLTLTSCFKRLWRWSPSRKPKCQRWTTWFLQNFQFFLENLSIVTIFYPTRI